MRGDTIKLSLIGAHTTAEAETELKEDSPRLSPYLNHLFSVWEEHCRQGYDDEDLDAGCNFDV